MTFVVMVVMSVLGARRQDAQILRRKCPSGHAADLEPILDIQTREIFLQLLSRKPEVEQRRSKHIARDPGKEIEMEDPLPSLARVIRVG